MKKLLFPFTAFVGQDELILGLVLNIINPKLGGLLIRGVKGSGKSTIVYSLSDIIPEIDILRDCKFNCDPEKPEYWCDECNKKYSKDNKDILSKRVEIISVPLSITEDRLLGNIDMELLLKKGIHRFVPGILVDAHRQILYIDEVNLLPDHIVDDILDVSASGWNKIEREGFSITHPSEFIMIGTMNPEEGELRPQILDRFPLSVEVSSITDESLRKEIIKRNLSFEEDPQKFRELFSKENESLKKIIQIARKNLDSVQVNEGFYDIVVKLCNENKVDGHRADIAIIKTAITYAAFELKNFVELRHIRQAAKFVLCHRTREGGFSKPITKKEIDIFFDNINIQDSIVNYKRNNLIINKNISLFSEGDLIRLEKK